MPKWGLPTGRTHCEGHPSRRRSESIPRRGRREAAASVEFNPGGLPGGRYRQGLTRAGESRKALPQLAQKIAFRTSSGCIDDAKAVSEGPGGCCRPGTVLGSGRTRATLRGRPSKTDYTCRVYIERLVLASHTARKKYVLHETNSGTFSPNLHR